MQLRYSKIYVLTLFLVLCSSIFGGNLSPDPDTLNNSKASPPSLIPLPQSVSWNEKMYKIPKLNNICYNKGSEKAANWLQELLRNANIESKKTQGKSCGNWTIITDSSLEEQLGDEGYLLDINSEGITLQSATDAGLFYAIQTLRQFFPSTIERKQLPPTEISLHQVQIEDQPAYSWRGTMVDVARSFTGLDYLKAHVDRMALYKLNRLHLHLTDDQGWRIEIKKYPKLTDIGAKGSVKGGNSGFLTQEDYLELQEYALARNIIIIPEIDFPGHIYSALVAYPELNCEELSNIEPKRATPPELYSGYEVGWSKLCLKKKEIYNFVDDVLMEMAEITKGPWLHIGGDEIEDPLYETFVVKADSIVQQKGKITIGWEEVTKAEVSSTLISQQWNGKTESVVDVKVIESICSNFYFDHANTPGQENTLNWCKEDGVSLEDVYSFSTNDPNTIGVEAPVWSEYVLNNETMDDRFWPRSLAVSEVAWRGENKKDFSNFVARVSKHGERLNEMGIHFFRSPEVEWKVTSNPKTPSTVFSDFE